MSGVSLFVALLAAACICQPGVSVVEESRREPSGDAQWIVSRIFEACSSGRREVVIPEVNPLTGRKEWMIDQAVVLPSDFTLVLDGAHLTLATGSFVNMFRADRVEGVRLIGRRGAVADGGVYNGLSERNADRDGRPPIWVNNTLLFTNVRDFRVEGIRFLRQRWWALNFVGCSKGVIRDIDFLANHTSRRPDGTVIDVLEQYKYEAVCVKNADGIDLRAGCHDILVENITGFTEDDSVALTCMPWIFEKILLAPGTPYEISDITVRNVRTSTYCSNVRILAQGGGRIRRVLVDGMYDTSDGKTYFIGRPVQGVNIGDSHVYGGTQCVPNDIDEITVRNVRSRAFDGVRIRGPVGRLTLENIEGFDGCQRVIRDQREDTASGL